jgi:SH3-like domain-containing protein
VYQGDHTGSPVSSVSQCSTWRFQCRTPRGPSRWAHSSRCSSNAAKAAAESPSAAASRTRIACGMQAHYDAEIAREQLAMELATIERMA